MTQDLWHAALLGVVEGVTEFLPISSTGHLILVARWLRLSGEAVRSFTLVIQAGAVAGIVGLYRAHMAQMWRGLGRRDAAGRRLLEHLVISLLPAALVGVLWHDHIKTALFRVGPVTAALAVGGAVMLVVDAQARRRFGTPTRALDAMTARDALVIGLAQFLALWPGTSRSMVTIVAAMLRGFPAAVAAEYSFLLALPTLGGAALFEAATGGDRMVRELGGAAVALGFVTSLVVAVIAMWGLVRYLTRHGLGVFGWYRLALATAVWVTMRAG